jgi:hypothetical protein
VERQRRCHHGQQIKITGVFDNNDELRNSSDDRARGTLSRRPLTIETGETMRYKAIAAALGAASLLAMTVAAVMPSTKMDYTIEDASATVTQGPDPTTMASESFSPAVTAPAPCGFVFTNQC